MPLDLDQPSANPILVEVTRGGVVESRHRGSVAVVDLEGKLAARWGDHTQPVFPRSAIKPVQALLLVESGAAQAFELSDREVALACSSHGGEPGHVLPVAAWLKRIGLGIDDLECGIHWPSHEPSARALAAQGLAPTQAHNNCSGKHAGFLTAALHLGFPTKGYVQPTHPVQQRILGAIEQMCGMRLNGAPMGIDGCSIPTFAVPLENLAYAFARFGVPDDLPPARAMAAKRIFKSMTENPFEVAGTDRYCTRLMAALSGRVMAKTGAEGVYCASLPEYGLGIALKIDDGASRAAEILLAAVLDHIGALDGLDEETRTGLTETALENRRGLRVGEIRSQPLSLSPGAF